MNYSKRLFVMFSLLFLCMACTKTTNYQKDENSVNFILDDAKLKIIVCNENIMQVKYTLADTFSTKKSLILEDKKWDKTPFDVNETNQDVTISTAKLKAKVNKITGEIAFYDQNDSLLLKEKAGGGKTIAPTSFENFKTQTIQQEFESPADEAIYGLGQHQDRLLNIKGYDLNLYQRNMEVYIPFYVSTKGYGLLWHNYAHTKFGDPDAVKAIPANNLFDEKGEQGGLSVSLFKDSKFEQPTQEDVQISPSIAVAKGAPISSATYTGSILADKTGEYAFYSYADGTFKLRVNDSLALDNWAPYANARDMGRIHLEKGKKYDIEVEWSRYHAKNAFELKWREPSDQSTTSLWSRAGEEINYYVVGGKSIDSIISGYRELTGKATLLPKWAMGFWQCRERYKTQDEILNTVKEFRKREVPLDVIVQDWQYWEIDKWGSATFETSRYPDPKKMIESLHEDLNTKFMISVWGKFYRNSDNFRELNKAGFLYQQPLKDSIVDFLKYKYTYYDAFNPEARKMYWNQLNEKLFSKGVDAWWMDASEPELPDHGATPDQIAHYMNPTFNGPGVANLNAFPLMHTKGVYEGQREAAPDKRVTILTRSAFAGEQKYGTIVWSGDISGEWSTLKASITTGLSLALSGMPYWTTDIGGFWVKYPGGNKNEDYRELFTRWYQFGAFCPIFRVHGSNTEREIWFFGDENSQSYQTQLKFNKLRYRLMPYIYTLNGMVNHQNYTIMRALVMDFPLDQKARNIDNQYMFGPSILVNPVTTPGATQREVYLPNGKGWFDFWTGKFYKGGQIITAPAPYNSMPLYIKAGAIVPFGPNLQYAMEKPADPMELRVYTSENGSFELYEDEGDNYNYENGAFSTIPFNWDENSQTLTIGERNGTFPGMLNERTIHVVFVDEFKGIGSQESTQIDKTVTYNGKEIKINK